MVEVFITDVQNESQAERISSTIKGNSDHLEICFDLNETDMPFPCGHTILRIEGKNINSDKILATVIGLGFKCEILEDKICIKK